MKSGRWILVMLLVCLLATPGAANPFAEVPAQHWSYEAIEYLANRGLVSGQRLWNFGSGRTVTRYEMAMLVGQALSSVAGDVEDGIVVTPAIVDRVRRLSVEYADELEVLGYSVSWDGREAQLDFDERARGEIRIPSVDPGLHRFVLTTDTGSGFRVHTGWIDRVPAWDEAPELQDVAISLDKRLLATLGSQEVSLNELTFQGQQLDGVRAVVNLGQLGSTVIIGKQLDDDYVAALDGRIELNDYVIVGGSYVRRSHEMGDLLNPQRELEALGSLGGTVILHPRLSLTGEYAQNLSTDSSGIKLGGSMKLGAMELGASFKTLEPGFEKDIPVFAESTGYGFNMRLGDLLISTERDLVLSEEELLRSATSYGVNFEVGNIGVLRAGYEYVDLDKLMPDEPRTTTSVGLDFYIPGGTIKADVVYAGDGTIPWSKQGDENFGLRSTSVGLGYSFNNDISLLLGYKLVDFNVVEDEELEGTETKATAEFAIRF
ncbi:MAG: hypothetical protein ACOYD6_04105 [Limnochordia bacterium]|jgi:hypothetical protein